MANKQVVRKPTKKRQYANARIGYLYWLNRRAVNQENGIKKTNVFLILMNIFCAFTKILPRKNEQIECFSIFGIRFAKCMEILSYN